MTLLKWLLGALVLFGGFVVFMYIAQRSLMYFPDTLRTPPADAGWPTRRRSCSTPSDGEKVIVWHLPPRGNKPVILYFHGNGGALCIASSGSAR